MLIPKSLASAAIAVVAMVSTMVQASPVPHVESEASVVGSSASLVKRSSAGWNDWNCQPSAAHPRPLVLVHGLLANGWDNWLYMAPRFAAKGYCVFTLSYGQMNGYPLIRGLDKMENSAQQLSDFVDKVLAATNTQQIDMFGHSQGSLMPRYYLKFLGGGPKVHKFAAIGAIQYGTDLLGLVNLMEPLGLYDPIKKEFDKVCLSCFEFLQNSTFIQNLNAGGDTVPGVEYLMIVSKYDEIVTPYKTGFLRDNNPKVQNRVIQDWCSLDISEHVALMLDPIAFNAVNAFLDPTADQTIDCSDAFH
ncbi:Alpha/Beta hydrolase protein [Mortierella sp. GBAus27b]|nr:hypothetical protein BGX31_000727 [Mortierella sp. GBA43]KAI8357199.1 Alpha/Beta hydrolase protein [Mortierella sp. GBAus27b]